MASEIVAGVTLDALITVIIAAVVAAAENIDG